jgi:hypothetical protein
VNNLLCKLFGHKRNWGNFSDFWDNEVLILKPGERTRIITCSRCKIQWFVGMVKKDQDFITVSNAENIDKYFNFRNSRVK